MTSEGAPGTEPQVADEPAGLRATFGRVLRVGVLISGAFLLTGFALAAARGSTGIAGQLGTLPLHGIGGALADGDPWAFLFLGVLVLAVTPVARVAVSLAGFLHAGDRPFVAITGFVLAVLLTSLAVGLIA
jgi:uncharacterized membrane protein